MSVRSSSGWMEYAWQCDACMRGEALADHDRREYPERRCSSCGRVMLLQVRPLAYDSDEVRVQPPSRLG